VNAESPARELTDAELEAVTAGKGFLLPAAPSGGGKLTPSGPNAPGGRVFRPALATGGGAAMKSTRGIVDRPR
jgi:hypothetical protein